MNGIIYFIDHLTPVFIKLIYLSMTAAIAGLAIFILLKMFNNKISPVFTYVIWAAFLFSLIIPFRPESAVNVYGGINLISAAVANISPSESFLLITSRIFTTVWSGGVLIGTVMYVCTAVKVRKKVKRGSLGSNVEIQEISDRIAAQYRIKRSILVITQDYINSPAIIGVFRPRIVLPSYAKDFGDTTMEYVLRHELAHYKRRDLWMNQILFFLSVVYWFNPAVWLFFKVIRQQMEMATDGYVLAKTGTENSEAYSISMLEVLEKQNKKLLIPKLTYMSDTAKNIKKRIHMIRQNKAFNKNKVLIGVVSMLIICIVSSLFLTSSPLPKKLITVSENTVNLENNADNNTVVEIPVVNVTPESEVKIESVIALQSGVNDSKKTNKKHRKQNKISQELKTEENQEMITQEEPDTNQPVITIEDTIKYLADNEPKITDETDITEPEEPPPGETQNIEEIITTQ